MPVNAVLVGIARRNESIHFLDVVGVHLSILNGWPFDRFDRVALHVAGFDGSLEDRAQEPAHVVDGHCLVRVRRGLAGVVAHAEPVMPMGTLGPTLR